MFPGLCRVRLIGDILIIGHCGALWPGLWCDFGEEDVNPLPVV